MQLVTKIKWALKTAYRRPNGMSHENNVVKWHFSDQAGKDQIIVNMMYRLEELEKYKAENEARKGVPSQLSEMEQRSQKPMFKLTKSLEKIAEYNDKHRINSVN